MTPPGVAAGLRASGPALLGFTTLTGVFFWPAVTRFRSHVLSAGGDGSTFLWAYWHMPRAAARLDNPFVTDAIFHPVGANLAFQTTTPLELVLSLPVARLLGLGAAVNLLQMVAVLLSAVGAYFLALHVCGDRRAAFFAGIAFAFVPYRFVHTGGHFNLVHAEFLPFGLLALLRLLDRPSRGRAVALGAVVGLTFLTDFYYTVFLLLAIAVLGWSRRREMLGAAMRPRLVEAGAVAALVAAPLAIPMIAALRAGELDPLPGWGGAHLYSADLLSWVVPPESHPLWGNAVAGLRSSLSGAGEGLAYPGLVVIALAVAGREMGDRSRRRGWVLLAVTAAVLAMGPFAHFRGAAGGLFSYLGTRFAMPLPYMAVHFVPVLNGVRVPGRFAIVAILALDVLAAVCLASVMRSRPRWAWPIVSAALMVTLVEFLRGPLPFHPVAVPEPYHRIASHSDGRAVLEVPLQWQTGVSVVGDRYRDDTIFMYFATVHGKPLVSGYTSRYPSRRLERLTAIPVYRQVLALAGEPGFSDPPEFGTQDLRRLGIGFVVYHRDRPQAAVHDYLAGLAMERLADDGTIVVWKVP